jgi:hypothetical protein
MARIKNIVIAGLVFLLINPGLLYSQIKPFIFFNVLPGADHTVLMQWRMKPEIDTLPFEVERGRDKKIWERIVPVNPHLSHLYSITDRQAGEGLIYYRIKQAGGKDLSIYTDIKWVQISKTGKLYIWPNPANNVLHVKTPFIKGSLDIIDPGGRLMLKITITDFITDVPVLRLSKGIYFLHAKYKKEILVEKFAKE